MRRRTNECRQLYLDILRTLIGLGLYQPTTDELADVILERLSSEEAHRDGRRTGEDWPALRMRQILERLNGS